MDHSKGKSMILMTAVLIAMALCLSNPVAAAEKPRVFVLTDIENEPDDAMSMVRFLTYANHFDIEGLAATTSVHQQNRVAPQRIRLIVEAYGKVRDTLEQHEQGFPTADALQQRITEGLPVYGMKGVGEGKDSLASEMLINAAEVTASVEGAVQWLGKVQMKGWRTDEVKNADGRRERP